MSKGRLLFCVLGLVVGLSDRAFAQSHAANASPAVRECAQAYENSQVQRSAGAISGARSDFERCRRADCPEFIRSDCSRWARELEAEQPTVIFSARRGSRTLTRVRVSIGSRVLTEQLNDQAIELDPGEYDFRFEAAEGGVAISHALIQAGNKDRLVQVEFSASMPEPTAASRPRAATESSVPGQAQESRSPPQSKAEAEPGPPVAPWVLLAVGAASVGAGAALSIAGHGEELRLRETCSPDCTDAQVAPVHTKYLLSDISFGVGLVSLSAAAYLFLSRSDPLPKAQGTVPVTVVAGANGIQAAYGARF